MMDKEKLTDRTSVVIDDRLKEIIRRRADSNQRSFSWQLRRDLNAYYRLITEGEKNGG